MKPALRSVGYALKPRVSVGARSLPQLPETNLLVLLFASLLTKAQVEFIAPSGAACCSAGRAQCLNGAPSCWGKGSPACIDLQVLQPSGVK